MVVFSKITAVAAGFSTLAAAMPTLNRPNVKSFSLSQSAIPRQHKNFNFAATYAKTLAKYGGQIPASLKAAAEKGSVNTYPEPQDAEYLTAVDVGGTTLNLDFDTGSADLWVFSAELPSSEQSGHAIYKPSSNATKLSGYSWSISYGDGSSASGDVYKDTVTVAGITAPQQAVEAASKISSEFTQDKNNDGLLGLAFSSINTVQPKPQTTWFDTVKEDLDSPLFAVALKHNAPGTFDFGYVDKSKYTGSLTYADVDNSQGFWQFTADSYSVGSQSGSESIVGIADTGTTLLLLPDDVVEAYYKQVEGAEDNSQAGGYVFPCDSQLPSFTAVINGYSAVVPGSLINYASVGDGSNNCLGGIQSDQGIGQAIFGDIFLKSQYVVFDADGPRLGFAPQA